MGQPGQTPQRLRAKGHWKLVSKIVVSFVGFFVAVGISQMLPSGERTDERTNLLWSIGASLFVAGIVFIAQYLVDVEKRLEVLEQAFESRLDTVERKFDDHATHTTARLEGHAEFTEQQITEGFSKIHLATELFSLREASQLNPDEMRHMT